MSFELFWFAFLEFMEKGGSVLWAILGMTFLLAGVIMERFWYLYREAKPFENSLQKALLARPVTYELLRLEYLARAAFFHNFGLLKMGVAMLPLFGLLGTVTGMIEVFEVMAAFGNSNPRLMASGVAKAIIPTMSGMAIAVVGLFALYGLQSLAQKRQRETIAKLKEVYNATL